ncbi:MAG TPA: acVLRF1 family peptidyl-tRNA hydrolase, partial [Actinomycetes bacterium]|nr:acVLRF1 family peptidyl-tRNA hydrolase [Actinomycetes bacterium]
MSVDAARLAGWLERFAARHGTTSWTASTTSVTVSAADGATAEIAVPFPPLAVSPDEPYAGVLAHVTTDRRVGVLLVRLGGHAAGVFEGQRLVRSKVGSRLVQGRSAAGGQSQQRFARRREGQARVALASAADVATRVLLPEADRL